MKTDNQIISDARGECDCDTAGIMCRIVCNGKRYNTDYSAWDAKLYQFVKDKQLANMFITFLMGGIVCGKVHRPKKLCLEALNKSPAQKAQALAKAIVENGKR